MNDTHLPDDLDQWPENPFELLGVDRHADARRVRRAYVRLIRHFKPEHFPHHFRRIREAYELLQWQLDLSAQDDGINLISSRTGPVRGDAPSPEHENDRPPGDEGRLTAERNGECPVAGQWRPAREGQPEAAYAGLREEAHRETGDEETYLRLYWVLLLWPDLQPDRRPADWLREGMAVCGIGGRLLALYVRELFRDPSSAAEPIGPRLMQAPGEPDALVQLAIIRWQAASFLGEWHVIPKDMVALRSRVEHESRPAWVRLLLSAIEFLLWQKEVPARNYVKACQREINECTDQHLDFEHELDRAEWLQYARDVAWRLEQVPRLPPGLVAECVSFMQAAWSQPDHVIRTRLLALLVRLTAQPVDGLALLDRLGRACSPLVQELCRQVDVLGYERLGFQEPGQWEHLEELAVALVEGRAPNVLLADAPERSSYPQLRKGLLMYCLRHAIPADALVAAIGQSEAAQLRTPGARQLAESLSEDHPLLCVSKACAALWPCGEDRGGW